MKRPHLFAKAGNSRIGAMAPTLLPLWPELVAEGLAAGTEGSSESLNGDTFRCGLSALEMTR